MPATVGTPSRERKRPPDDWRTSTASLAAVSPGVVDLSTSGVPARLGLGYGSRRPSAASGTATPVSPSPYCPPAPADDYFAPRRPARPPLTPGASYATYAPPLASPATSSSRRYSSQGRNLKAVLGGMLGSSTCPPTPLSGSSARVSPADDAAPLTSDP